MLSRSPGWSRSRDTSEGDKIRILYHDDTTNTNIVLKSWLIKGREQLFIAYPNTDTRVDWESAM